MNNELTQILEGILFVWGEPIEITDLEDVLQCSKKEILEAFLELQKHLETQNRGIILKQYDNAFQLVTIPKIHKYIEKLVETSPKKLTTSSMEVLSIIAYKQPVTRLEIERIRGVKSNSSIDTLLSKGMIKECGRLNQIGKPILYCTTVEFLKCFDLGSLEELPKISEEE